MGRFALYGSALWLGVRYGFSSRLLSFGHAAVFQLGFLFAFLAFARVRLNKRADPDCTWIWAISVPSI